MRKTLNDEVDIYNRERALGFGVSFDAGPDTKKYTPQDVIDFGKKMDPPAYQDLPKGSIDINSKEGKELRRKTREAGQNGSAVTEVYKGWKKDYKK